MEPELVAAGFRRYHERCELCHGAPGVSPREIGKGLTPEPTALSEAVSRWSAEELFWIIKYGIRMTGMPAWGGSYPDAVLWPLVAFVQKLPEISPNMYQEMVTAVESETSEASQ
jgi:mono/diheme cytochrome c family protein